LLKNNFVPEGKARPQPSSAPPKAKYFGGGPVVIETDSEAALHRALA